MEVTLEPFRLSHGFLHEEFDQLMVMLCMKDVSDIAIETNKPIWAKLHGYRFRATTRPIQDFEVRNIVTWLYGANGVAEVSKGIAKKARYEVMTDAGGRYAFRVNFVGCYTPRARGIHIALRTIPLVVPTLDEMVLPDDIRNNVHFDRGLGLVVGATGHGKSTLLAAINADKLTTLCHRKILTFESPIEFDLQGIRSETCMISQREIGIDLQTFYDGVVCALREEPTDILIGEARDRETINGTLHACESGHATYATVHAESVATTFLRIANEFPQEQMSQVLYKLFSQIRLVVVQQLALAATPGRRVPIREWLVFGEEFRRELMRMAPLEAVTRINDEVIRRGQSIRQQALLTYQEGRITEETLKTIAGEVNG